MQYVNLLRPEAFSKTPFKLARALGARSWKYPNKLELPVFDTDRDLIMCWPNVNLFSNGCATDLVRLVGFYNKNKYEQRVDIRNYGLPTPASYQNALCHAEDESGERLYVKRPKRHHGGSDFEVISSLSDSDITKFYYDPLIRRTNEYRLIFVKGVHVLTLSKVMPDGAPIDQPWNHSNGSRFVTVNKEQTSWFKHSRSAWEFLADLHAHPVVMTSHILGVDMFYNKETNSAGIFEFNFAPALEIEDNFNKVVEALLDDDLHTKTLVARGTSPSYMDELEADYPDYDDIEDDYLDEDYSGDDYPEEYVEEYISTNNTNN